MSKRDSSWTQTREQAGYKFGDRHEGLDDYDLSKAETKLKSEITKLNPNDPKAISAALRGIEDYANHNMTVGTAKTGHYEKIRQSLLSLFHAIKGEDQVK
jgi:hypothetical protein